ncbi:hypothetical protein SAMN05444000_1157 [Shimia gijangensis]|uniref:Uncharacterized protein n=1 Tax=Shimia gijangensis TaxID=1470563 RepID=A0A1M6N1J0_9RHOB|nr:hypothetical protein SAMN05444000_1157 [Shimia gijangensis]
MPKFELDAWEYLQLSVCGLAHAVEAEHLLNRSRKRIAN